MVKFLLNFTRRPTWGFSDFLALVLLLPLTSIWLASPLIWPAQSWLYLSKVSVSDFHVGDEITINVDRELYRSTAHGSYRVTVRSYPELVTQCGSGGYVEVPYDADAQLSFEDDVDLDWWAWGPYGNCDEWTPEEGQYVIDTEHCWRRFTITRLACRSVRSNVFNILENPDEE